MGVTDEAIVGMAEGASVSVSVAVGVGDSLGENGVALDVCVAGIAGGRDPAKNIKPIRKRATIRRSAGSLLRQTVYISTVIHQVQLPRLV